MKHLSKWILCLVTLATVAGISGAWTHTTRPQGQQGGQQGHPAGQQADPHAKGKKATPIGGAPKGRAKKHQAIKEALEKSKEFSREGLQKGLLQMNGFDYLGVAIEFKNFGNGLRDAAVENPVLFQYKGGKLTKMGS